MMAQPNVTVVGGGIIGASIAWHLVAVGAKVRLIAETHGGVATPTSFAWINASWGNPEFYFKLRMRSIEEWPRLASAVPSLPFTRNGGICWDLPDADLLAFAEQHSRWGYAITQISPDEASAIEPAVKSFPPLLLHVTDEGAAEPAITAERLIADAVDKGLDVMDAVRVTALQRTGNRITALVTDEGEIGTDHVVLAAGAETMRLAATVGIDIPLEAPPGLIVHSKPAAKMLNGLVIATELHVRQTLEGRIIAGSDFGGTDPGTDPDGAAHQLFDKVKAFLKGGEALEMDFYTVGYRPTPKDGYPILGHVAGIEGLYLAVTHSGVTLAPAIGLFAAREITTGALEPLLEPFRLERFG